MAMVSYVELMLVVMMGLPFNQVIGLPPGEQDAKLANMASVESVMYLEWAGRSEGKAGAPGVDGIAADPEVIKFINQIKMAIQTNLVKESNIADLKLLPELVVEMTGHPGCLFLEFMGDERFEPDSFKMAALQSLRGGLIVSAGDEADKIAKKIQRLASLALRQEVTTLDHLMFPAPIPVEIHQHEGYIILGFGEDGVSEILDRLKSGKGGISEHEGYQDGLKNLEVPRLASVAFIDSAEIMDRVSLLTTDPMAQGMITTVGLDKVQWGMMVNGVNADGVFVSRAKLKGDLFDQGIFSSVQNGKIRPEDLTAVPSDSDMVVSASFDFLTLIDAYMEIVPPGFRDQVKQEFTQAGLAIGLDWERDVRDVFSNTYVLSDSPGDGGWMLTAPVISVAFKDKDAAKNSVAKFTRALRQTMPQVRDTGYRKRGVTLETRDFLETEIFMVNTIGEEAPIAPAWCLTDTHLLIAMHPQTLKSRLRRMARDDWKAWDDFKNAPDGEMFGMGYTNTEELVRRMYGLAPWFGQVLFGQLQSEGIDLTLFDFPSAPAILPYMSKSRSYAVRTADGLELYTEGPPVISSVPVAVPALLPTMFFATLGVRQVRVNAIEAAMVEEAIVELDEADAVPE